MATSPIEITSVIDITSSVTFHSNISKSNSTIVVKRYGNVVSIKALLSVTGDISNGEILIGGLLDSGINYAHESPILQPVRSGGRYSVTPSKYHFISIRGGMIINGTTTLKSGDYVQIDTSYIAV